VELVSEIEVEDRRIDGLSSLMKFEYVVSGGGAEVVEVM